MFFITNRLFSFVAVKSKNTKMKYHFLIVLVIILSIVSCKNTPEKASNNEPLQTTAPEIVFKNKGHELVYEMTQKTGDYNALAAKKDVVYTYTYETPDGKKDVSTEKYIFNGELSYGQYQQHERTLPQLEGTIEQGYNGSEFWLKHQGAYLEDEAFMKRVVFNRKTNFYWFAMFQKLLDPGLHYEYLHEAVINTKKYDLVKVTFESEDDSPKDIYLLYINQNTKLVDQFLFTVVDFNVVENPMLMQLEYEEIDGMLIPTKRQYKKSTWDAQVSDEPWINVTWSNITFNNHLTAEEFNKK